MSPEEIAPLIPSSRPGGIGTENNQGVNVRTVLSVLMRQRVFKDVKNIPPKVRRRKMLEGHAALLIDVIKKRPYLLIDEVAR